MGRLGAQVPISETIDPTTNDRTGFDLIDYGQNESVCTIFRDIHERLWVAASHDPQRGICHIALYDKLHKHIGYLSPEGKVVGTHDRMAFHGTIQCFLGDSQGRIWMGSRHDGLFILVPQDDEGMTYRIIQYEADMQSGELSGNTVSDIVEDVKGRIWIGCVGGGLNLVARPTDVDRLTFYNFHNGLDLYPSDEGDRVHNLCITSRDELLINTDFGIISCSLLFDQTEDMSFYHYSYDGQLPDNP